MIAHMAQTHGECPSCDICAKYFGTFQILKEHNEALHKELDIEPEVIEDICGAEEVQLHCKKKKKKKKSKKQNITKQKDKLNKKKSQVIKGPCGLYRTPVTQWSAHGHKEWEL